MTRTNHKQAHVLLQQEKRTVAEEQALNLHLADCSDCQAYARIHRELQQSLILNIPLPELNRAKIGQLTGAMKRRARRKQQMNGIVAIFRPVLAGGIVVALLVWGLSLFTRPPAAPEPAAVVVATDPTATAIATPTATPEPTVNAQDGLIEVDLQGTETHPHPQVGSRFRLTLEQVQQEISFPLRVLTLLPDGFVFAGADLTDGTVTQLFVLAGESPILSVEQGQGHISIPGRDDQQDAEGVTIEPVEGIGDAGLHYVDGIRGITGLSWAEEGMSYQLQVSGAIWPLERLQALARSLRPLSESESAAP